jgi:uncharacterized protein (TIGR03067 family)
MRRVVPPLIVLCLGFAPAPLPKLGRKDEVVADLRAIQGEWLRESALRNGRQMRSTPGSSNLIEGDQLCCRSGRVVSTRWTIVVRPGGQVGAIDMHHDGDVLPCIYRLEGDTLTFCFATGGGARPSEFTPREGVYVEVFKRKRQ